MTDADEILVERAQRGDAAAFDQNFIGIGHRAILTGRRERATRRAQNLLPLAASRSQ